MKRLKNTLALTLAATLVCSTGVTAFAADTDGLPAPVKAETVEVVVPKLTYDQALEMAKKKSIDLRALRDTNEFLQDSKADLYDAGFFSIPKYDYQRWVNDAVYGYTSAVYSTDSRLTQNKYLANIQNLTLETTIKSTFSSIKESEANLELAKERSALQKTLYEQGKTKHALGMLSQYSLDQLAASCEAAETMVTTLESTLEQLYRSLNNTLGAAADARFEVVYEVEYEPYELQGSLESYINASLNKDYSILLSEQEVEDAKFAYNFMAESTSNSQRKSNELAYDNAKRALKSAKEQKELAIRNAYTQLKQSEVTYAATQTELAQAQADYNTAKVNYEAGNITKLALDQAALGVTDKEITLRNLEYAHDMQVFTFKNTSLLGGGSAGQ